MSLNRPYGHSPHARRNRHNPPTFRFLGACGAVEEFVDSRIGLIQKCNQVGFSGNLLLCKEAELSV